MVQFWNTDTVGAFNSSRPEFAYDDVITQQREMYTERFSNVYYSTDWWRLNMSLLDRIILKVAPKLSPFNRGTK